MDFSLNKFKDSDVQNTILRTSKILMNEFNDILLYDWNCSPYYSLYSCGLKLNECNNVCANGKGVNPFYCQASGQSELLERLSGFVVAPRRYDTPYYKDEVIIDGELHTVFFNCSLNSYEYLPISVLRGSNGFAAGNTYEEAIVQALSEIIEREHIRKFFNKTLKNNGVIYYNNNGFERLRERFEGEFVFFDVATDIKFPVVLLVYFSPIKNVYSLNFGCAPSYELACERCYTEFFQGVSITVDQEESELIKYSYAIDIPEDKAKYDYDFQGFLRANHSFIPRSCLDTFFTTKLLANNNFTISFKNNIEIVKYLINQESFFGDIKIKDVGFLDYPVIKVIASNFFVVNNSDGFYLDKIKYITDEYFICSDQSAQAEELYYWLVNRHCSENTATQRVDNKRKAISEQLREKSILFDFREKNNLDFLINIKD